MARKLKTFLTSLGFFDQAVAAPSMKAALEAWGADSNLFHQGFAREVDDPAIVEATMARPGIVLKRPIGSSGPFREFRRAPHRTARGEQARPTPTQAAGQTNSRAEEDRRAGGTAGCAGLRAGAGKARQGTPGRTGEAREGEGAPRQGGCQGASGARCRRRRARQEGRGHRSGACRRGEAVGGGGRPLAQTEKQAGSGVAARTLAIATVPGAPRFLIWLCRRHPPEPKYRKQPHAKCWVRP